MVMWMDPYFLVFKQPDKVSVRLVHMNFCRKWIVNLSSEFTKLSDK